jgi:hypothetical protein
MFPLRESQIGFYVTQSNQSEVYNSFFSNLPTSYQLHWVTGNTGQLAISVFLNRVIP